MNASLGLYLLKFVAFVRFKLISNVNEIDFICHIHVLLCFVYCCCMACMVVCVNMVNTEHLYMPFLTWSAYLIAAANRCRSLVCHLLYSLPCHCLRVCVCVCLISERHDRDSIAIDWCIRYAGGSDSHVHIKWHIFIGKHSLSLSFFQSFMYALRHAIGKRTLLLLLI